MGIDSAPGPGVFLTELPELKPDAKELVASAAPAVPLPRSDKDDSSAKNDYCITFGFDAATL